MPTLYNNCSDFFCVLHCWELTLSLLNCGEDSLVPCRQGACGQDSLAGVVAVTYSSSFQSSPCFCCHLLPHHLLIHPRPQQYLSKFISSRFFFSSFLISPSTVLFHWKPRWYQNLFFFFLQKSYCCAWVNSNEKILYLCIVQSIETLCTANRRGERFPTVFCTI